MNLKLRLKEWRPVLRVVWILCFSLIALSSLLPPSALPSTPGLTDKAQHFLAYFMAGSLGLLASDSVRHGLVAGLLLMCLGFGLELGQLLVPGRAFEWTDFLANNLGVGSGMAAGAMLRI